MMEPRWGALPEMRQRASTDRRRAFRSPVGAAPAVAARYPGTGRSREPTRPALRPFCEDSLDRPPEDWFAADSRSGVSLRADAAIPPAFPGSTAPGIRNRRPWSAERRPCAARRAARKDTGSAARRSTPLAFLRGATPPNPLFGTTERQAAPAPRQRIRAAAFGSRRNLRESGCLTIESVHMTARPRASGDLRAGSRSHKGMREVRHPTRKAMPASNIAHGPGDQSRTLLSPRTMP